MFKCRRSRNRQIFSVINSFQHVTVHDNISLFVCTTVVSANGNPYWPGRGRDRVSVNIRACSHIPTHYRTSFYPHSLSVCLSVCLSVWHNSFLTFESPPKNVVLLFGSTCQNRSLCYCNCSQWFVSSVRVPLRQGQLHVFIADLGIVKWLTTLT